jgi:hypothetical protein
MAQEATQGATATTFALTHQSNDESLSAVMLDDEQPLEFNIELSGSEKQMLRTCEEIIECGFTHFMQVGEALATIRKARLYKENFLSFEAYCQDKWGFGRYRALQYIQAVDVGRNLVTNNHSVAGLNTRQLGLLRPLDPDSQVAVMTRARNLAGTKKLKTAHIIEAIEIVNNRGTSTVVDAEEVDEAIEADLVPAVASISTEVAMPRVTLDMLTGCCDEIEEMLDRVEYPDSLRSAFGKLRSMVVTFAEQTNQTSAQEAA